MISTEKYKELMRKFRNCSCTEPNCCEACQVINEFADKMVTAEFNKNGQDVYGEPARFRI